MILTEDFTNEEDEEDEEDDDEDGKVSCDKTYLVIKLI